MPVAISLAAAPPSHTLTSELPYRLQTIYYLHLIHHMCSAVEVEGVAELLHLAKALMLSSSAIVTTIVATVEAMLCARIEWGKSTLPHMLPARLHVPSGAALDC